MCFEQVQPLVCFIPALLGFFPSNVGVSQLVSCCSCFAFLICIFNHMVLFRLPAEAIVFALVGVRRKPWCDLGLINLTFTFQIFGPLSMGYGCIGYQSKNLPTALFV